MVANFRRKMSQTPACERSVRIAATFGLVAILAILSRTALRVFQPPSSGEDHDWVLVLKRQ